MIPIPKHMREYAVSVKKSEEKNIFTLKCPCACEKFSVYKNVKNKSKLTTD